MKIVKMQGAQGDMYFRKIEELPEELELVEPQNGKYVLAHSETGHHHITLERPTVKLFKGMDVLRSFLVVEEEPAELIHLRKTHTHETQALTPGIWEIIRQREFDLMEGWRFAAD